MGAAIVLAGCTGGGPDKAPAEGNAAGHGAGSMANVAVPKVHALVGKPQELASKTDAFEFGYNWPAAANAIPELDAWLRDNGEKLRKAGQAEAASDAASAKKDGYPFNSQSYDEDYAVVADTPRMLVLLSEGYVYTGGAHGMPINTAIIWDKVAKKRLATSTLIAIPRFAALAKSRFCTELDRQRAEKRGEPVSHDDPNGLVDFVSCVDMTKQLILPVSVGGKALDTIRVVIGPYEAGPYAEGSYVIDLAMDKALLGAVKDGYREAFGAR
jgi:hypothetical protein